MNFYRKNPVFGIVLTVCAVLVLAELALIYERIDESRDARKKLEQRNVDLQAMAQLVPPPTHAVDTAIQADLKKAQGALVSMQGELRGRGPTADQIHNAKPPVARTDAYFDLATFVEKTRALATKHEVDIRPETARFGFAAYANEGPVQEHIEPVFRQRQVAQYLLESLIEARPRTILTVKRERTVTKAEREARAASLANGDVPIEIPGDEGPDYFTVDSRVSARMPGFIDTMAFQFVFTGQTAALRTFLNRLASFELPILVREVEVDTPSAEEMAAQSAPPDESAPAPDPSPAAASQPASVVLSAAAPAASLPKQVAPKAAAPRGARASASAPIVSKPFSKFTVTVEFVELVPPAVPAAEAAATPPPS